MVDMEAGAWPVDYSLADCDVFDSTEGSPLKDDAELVAVNVLWNFTRRIFGTKEVVLRPVPRSGYQPPSTFRGRSRGGASAGYPHYLGTTSFWQPIMLDGQWYNLRSVAGDDGPRPWSLELPGPVQEVTQVQIGATVVPSTEYRLEGSHLIHKTDSWPTSQDVRGDIGDEGTWAITYTKGLTVPRQGQLAAGILACEIGKGALGRDCALPERVQTITRQQVTMAIIDTFEDLEKGRTGIPRVDMWIASINKERSAATVARSVDVRPRAVR